MWHDVDAIVVRAAMALAIYLVLSGLDDLFLDIAWLVTRLRRIGPIPKAPTDDPSAPVREIAIFVPLWHEAEVIASMLAHNIAAIRYSKYDFFVGVYPNDGATMEAVREVEARYANVHLAVCPHDGPTSKADCLNWVYQQMLLFEERSGRRFDLIVTHDAEDLIHPESLKWMNRHAGDYDFIQIPVLALRTSPFEWTHGVYCDEFAEFQLRDLPARNRLGGFVPSAGVGTAYSRAAIEALALAEKNCIFEPTALTEDYENGWRLNNLGFAQIYLPPQRGESGWVATREYFPRRWRAAVRQRTRWVMGIALQSWESHGWSGGRRQAYWLWRDRKGLLGAPLSFLTNLMTVYCAATGLWREIGAHPVLAAMCWLTMILQLVRIGVRMGCVRRVYGWNMALLVAPRVIYANALNAVAVCRAVWRFGKARLRGEPLVWLKTSHSYPNRSVLTEHRRKLGEILAGSGYVQFEELERALATQPSGRRLGEYLMELGLLEEGPLYEALSIQQGVPLGAPSRVSKTAARALPAHVMEAWKVLPFRIESGRLFIAGSDVPTEAMHSTLRSYTSLEVRFHLVTPRAFEEMKKSIH